MKHISRLMKEIKEKINCSNFDKVLIETFPSIKKKTLMIFKNEIITEYGDAKILDKTDYNAYEIFFRTENPTSDPSDWLKDYFLKKTSMHYFVGYYKGDQLVSVCDAPDMPYMTDEIQHTGISTLVSERKKGYAKKTCALAIKNLIKLGMCPQWETDSNNQASINLAKSIGFEIHANAYILEE